MGGGARSGALGLVVLKGVCLDVRCARRVLLGTSLALAVSSLDSVSCHAQQPMLSEHAVTAQTVAGTTITVEYYRPLARGRDSLFGKVVTWGSHWTPGANWATTIEVDRDIRLNSAPLPKGRYAVWAFVEPDRWTLELRRTWRKFHVPPPSDSGDVQLRLEVKPESGPMTDVLTFDSRSCNRDRRRFASAGVRWWCRSRSRYNSLWCARRGCRLTLSAE